MHAQRETREADQENLRLAELLRQVLPLVGIEADIITPLKGPSPGNGLPMLTAGVREGWEMPVRCGLSASGCCLCARPSCHGCKTAFD